MRGQGPGTRQKEYFLIRGIRRNVFFLGLVSFFNDVSSEMLYPLIPIFLTAVLGAPMAVVGLIEGIAESTASLLKVFSGWYSDRVARRLPLVVGGYSLSAIAKPLLALAAAWPVVLALRFTDRLGKGIRTSARDALIADSTDEQFRGRSFGFHRGLDTAGAAVGPLLALVLLQVLSENLRLIFLLSFPPALIGVLLLLLVKERPVGREQAVPNNGGGPAQPEALTGNGSRLSLALGDRRFRLFLVATVIFALGNSSDVFLILRAKDLGFSTALVVLAYAFYNMVYASTSTHAGMLSDRMGRRPVLVIGFLVFAAVYLGFALVREAALVWGLFAAYGLYMAMTDGVGKAFVVDLSPAETRGTALGVYHMAVGIMSFAASFIAGLLWTFVGAPAPFLMAAVTGLMAAGVLVIGRSR